jgi:hypothetical protein
MGAPRPPAGMAAVVECPDVLRIVIEAGTISVAKGAGRDDWSVVGPSRWPVRGTAPVARQYPRPPASASATGSAIIAGRDQRRRAG